MCHDTHTDRNKKYMEAALVEDRKSFARRIGGKVIILQNFCANQHTSTQSYNEPLRIVNLGIVNN